MITPKGQVKILDILCFTWSVERWKIIKEHLNIQAVTNRLQYYTGCGIGLTYAVEPAMLKDVIGIFAKLALAKAVRDDDVVDQLHHYAMVATLAMLGVAVAAKQFVGKPIHCWIPAQYPNDDQQDYVNSLCWVSRMYNVPFNAELPVSIEDRMADDKDIGFYRWAMVIFFLQAIMFELPHLFWRGLKGYSGVNIKKIVSMCMETQLTNQKDHDKKLGDTAHFIDRWLKTYRRYGTSFSSLLLWNKRSGCYLTRLYLLTKLLYVANVIGQFKLLSVFLGFNYWSYGADVTRYLADDIYWEDLHHFPRIGLCDFEIRQLQNLHRYTVQCVLSVNLFLEKIFAGQWFVLAVLSAVTVINAIFWFVEELIPSRKEKFLYGYLDMIQGERRKRNEKDADTKLFRRFVRCYLRSDGVFLLRTVGNNTTEVLSFELSKKLWTAFEKEHHKNDNTVVETELSIKRHKGKEDVQNDTNNIYQRIKLDENNRIS